MRKWLVMLASVLAMADEPVYRLEGKVVTEKRWEEFKRTLKGMDDYVCKKMEGGGETSYVARAPDGHRYRVRMRTTSSENENEITRKKD